MRLWLLFVTLLAVGSAAQAQSSSTNCYAVGNTVHCNTQSQPGIDWNAWSQQQQQQQQQLNQSMQNLGAAIAARQERHRREKAAKEQAALLAKMKALVDAQPVAGPPPADEPPVTLVCTTPGHPTATLQLYEHHNRIDATSADGITRTHTATFTPNAITWDTPITHLTLNRLDGSYTAVGSLPEIAGQSLSGSCSLATERKF